MAKTAVAITHNLGEQKTQPANLLKHQCFLGLVEACKYEPNMYMCVFCMIVHKDSKIVGFDRGIWSWYFACIEKTYIRLFDVVCFERTS